MEPFQEPGRSIPHVAEEIFRFLDKETLAKCRKVNWTWKNYLENPSFWFQKLGWMKIGIPNDHVAKSWKELAQKVKEHGNETVTQLFVLPLIKMVDRIPKHPLKIVADLEESKKPENYPVLVDFILEHLDPQAKVEIYGSYYGTYTPILLAADFGKIEVMKNLVGKYI